MPFCFQVSSQHGTGKQRNQWVSAKTDNAACYNNCITTNYICMPPAIYSEREMQSLCPAI